MKKKHLITSVAAIVGVVMLTAASIATYATANGYSAAKNAAKNILKEDNLTLKAEIKCMVDGKEIEKEEMLQKFDKDGLVKFNDIGSGRRTMTIQDNMDVTFYDNDLNGIPNKDDRIYTYDLNEKSIRNRIWLYDANDSKEAQSMIRFAELLTDTLVGDLKNNIILTDSTDETDTYTLSLDAYQIPELYQAGFEMLVATESRYSPYQDEEMSEEEYYKRLSEGGFDIGFIFEKDPKISSAEANVVMDKEGRLRKVNGSVLFEGLDYFDKVHTVEMSLNIEAYDYGTTVCDRIDVGAAINAGADASIGYNLEERLESVAERMKDMEINKEKYEDDEYVQRQIENQRVECENLQKIIDSPEYARYKEIMNELIYGTLSDEERKALVDEKTQIVESRVLEDYPERVMAYPETMEAASVGIIGGEDGPTAIVVSEEYVPAETEVTD